MPGNAACCGEQEREKACAGIAADEDVPYFESDEVRVICIKCRRNDYVDAEASSMCAGWIDQFDLDAT